MPCLLDKKIRRVLRFIRSNTWPRGTHMIVCGIDGGQSSTRCVLATDDGELLGFGRGGPLIHLSAVGGETQFVSSIQESVTAAWQSASCQPLPITAAVIGATGIFEDTIESITATRLLSAADVLSPQQSDPTDPLTADTEKVPMIHVCSDALIALFGAHAGEPGIMVISGTGTIAYGMDHGGNIVRSGGWGWLIGDEGSAYAIGRSALRAALYAFDGMGAQTQLQTLVAEYFAVSELHDVKRLYFAPEFGAAGFAKLAPLVSTAVANGDTVAQAILIESGEALAREALAVAAKFNEQRGALNVAPIGGAFEHVSGLKEAFANALSLVKNDQPLTTNTILGQKGLCQKQQGTVGEKLQKTILNVTDPLLPPVSGAALMAIQKCGGAINEKLINSMQSWDLA